MLNNPNQHWLLGSKSYLDYPKNEYLMGVEPQVTSTFLEVEIKEPEFFKHVLPRYYLGLIRKARNIRFYDPMITVRSDHVSFLMRDIQNDFWELALTAHVFKDYNGQEGQCFVDFNTNFIQQIRILKSNAVNMLKIDQTGLSYTGGEETTHLPHEDRGTLIKLLYQVEQEFLTTPDNETEINTVLAWNQMAPIRMSRYPFSLYESSLITPFLGRPKINFSGVENPFRYIGDGMQYVRSPAAKYFSKTTLVKMWEETNQYLFTIPLIHPQKEVLLGAFRFQTRSQRSLNPNNFRNPRFKGSIRGDSYSLGL